jgi:hypothetical protein
MPKISEYTELVTPTDDDLLVTVSAGVTKKIKRANFLGKTLNYIGIAGTAGFGVGICPNTLPAGMLALPGYDVIGNDQYGNYQYSDGSIMVWVPKFYYKVLHDGSTNINKVLIASVYDYENETAANAAGYALHRAFIDGGVIKDGFFIDKYKWSLTAFVNGSAGIASSIKNGNPITSSDEANRDATNLYAGAFADCISNSQTPAANYGGAWAAAKSRGANFAVWSMFIHSAIALLSLAHGQAATSTTNCAWYLTNKNYVKGNNNYGADIDDATCTFSACTDSYWASRNEARQNGSGTLFAKTTHNGQSCGISDLQGDQWQIAQGLTCISASQSIATGNISIAAQAVIAITAHGYSDGDIIFIDGANSGTGWNTAMQYRFFTVSDKTADTLKLKKRTNDGTDGNYLDTSALSAYDTANGTFSCVKGVFYTLKESATLKNVTGGSGAATDHFNNTTIFDVVDISGLLVNTYASDLFGSGTNQVLPMHTSRTNNDYRLSALAMPKDKNSISGGGSNTFGTDYFLKWIRHELCPILGGDWSYSTGAGVWSVYLSYGRTTSYSLVSARACLYV